MRVPAGFYWKTCWKWMAGEVDFMSLNRSCSLILPKLRPVLEMSRTLKTNFFSD